MSNYNSNDDKLNAHLEELRRKHRELDTLIETKYHNYNITDEVRKLKTQKLWLKDEIHRVEAQLKGPAVNGFE
jgi:uncharacterized protein YdcH (DUF465 family)